MPSITDWQALSTASPQATAALDAYKRARQTVVARPDAFDIATVSNFRVLLYACLGDRDDALRAIEHLLKQRAFLAAGLRRDLSLFSLRGDPRLEALLKDPANNGPLPIVNWDLEKMLAELSD